MPLNPDRFFPPDTTTRNMARDLYEPVANMPIISPHGHVDPSLFADPNATFGSPADLFIIPDHYVTRMLYSQGIALEDLGIHRIDGGVVEKDHRKIWRVFCENFHLFRGTPSGIWLEHELNEVFGINEKPSSITADQIYDVISEKITTPEYSPRNLFKRFHIEVLSTTDSATDTLEMHQAIHRSWDGRVIPCLRPDNVINLDTPGWRRNIDQLMAVSGIDITDYKSFLSSLWQRREFFKSMGAVATDHAVKTPTTFDLSKSEAEAIFQRALKGQASSEDARCFTANMLMEMARMSSEDGLVIQLHPGSFRNHNKQVFQQFGLDKGADIPIKTEYTRNLQPLLNKYGNNHNLTIILFTLDETNYARELAPLAGHYPVLKLGPPWWFHDSLNGIARFLNQVIETAGIYNTTGFNDDTRAFCSIPARHDIWRRATASWLAGLVAQHIVSMNDAHEMMTELAVGLAKRAYNFDY